MQYTPLLLMILPEQTAGMLYYVIIVKINIKSKLLNMLI